MTTQTLSSRDAKAKSVIESVLSAELAGQGSPRIIVTPRDNHSGEPALYVLVVVASERDIPAEREQHRLVVKMIEALEQIEEARFPYLFFDFPSADAGAWSEARSAAKRA